MTRVTDLNLDDRTLFGSLLLRLEKSIPAFAHLPDNLRSDFVELIRQTAIDCLSSVELAGQGKNGDRVAVEAGQTFARAAKTCLFSSDEVLLLGKMVREFCARDLGIFSQSALLGDEGADLLPGHYCISFFDSFIWALAKEWLYLETLPYHKKLREANRYILHEKRRYYTIFNRMAEPAFIVDQDLRLVETNKAFDRFFNVSGRSHIGKLCHEVLGAAFCSVWSMDDILKQTSFAGIETVMHVAGQEKYVIIAGTFLGDINSERTGGIIIIQDITQRKEVERALRKSEEKYRSLIENVPDVTWRADQQGRYSFISQNVVKICGYTQEELLACDGEARFLNIHPEDMNLVRNAYGHFFTSQLPAGIVLRDMLGSTDVQPCDPANDAGKRRYDVTYRFRKKNGAWIWLHDRASVIYEQDGVWYADGVFSDITELKEAEEELERHHFRLAEMVDERTSELREVNRQLKQEVNVRRQAEKELYELAAKLQRSNEELEQFAHVASHDLREPLMLIRAFSEKLKKKYSTVLDAKGHEYVKRILSAARQMHQLIEGILELSRVTSNARPFEEIDLTALVAEVVQNLEGRIEESAGSVRFGELGRLGGDKMQIRQLFQNIIANALKYRKEGVCPTVILESDVSADNFCEITIQDNGIGFEQHHVERIFKPLERLHGRREFEGTGMGLATCQKIVVRHGGEITAKSEPGKGATFIVRLPVTPPGKE